MKMKTKLVMITAMFVMAMAMASTPVSAGSSDKCSEYHFIYTDGHEDQGEQCEGNEVSSDPASKKKYNPDLHVKTLHVSCSDTIYENGTAKKSNLDGHLVASWLIIKTDDGEEKKRCGTGIPEEPDPICEDLDLKAEALDGGNIKLTMNALDVDEYRLWKAVGAGPLVQILTVPANTTMYLDEDTEIGQSYTYAVQIVLNDEVVDTCQVEITAVPVFGSLLASGLAVSLGLLGYLGARRRQ